MSQSLTEWNDRLPGGVYAPREPEPVDVCEDCFGAVPFMHRDGRVLPMCEYAHEHPLDVCGLDTHETEDAKDRIDAMTLAHGR